ncbi:MAG: T9SS C-terminal target domain-containing protein [Calditrichaeota bacterium]|nr:MAG: T9SS C-terminal target domain-containing protein [Calditrichota bacterium]MBL1205924.1 T9SS C-terminal target domain-containing protein [Calditrichota bacterium]NOG45752.1 S8 family serine peptidase [Calditrichota bacterium]
MKILLLILTILCLVILNSHASELLLSETKVDSVQATYGLKGNGVIIAILDRGIDYEHPDFTNDDGSSRILAIYDMLDPAGATASNNPYGIGTIYNQADIDTALSTGIRLSTRDAVGHGTATAGIAGGNGAVSAGKYQGIAPEASFIIVKITSEGAPAHNGEAAEAAFYNPDYIQTAITFVKSKASEMNMPFVMLANFGSIGAPMDGSSSLSRMIDSEFGPGHPGQIFVSGSSDGGGMDNHASGTISQGDTIEIKINKTTSFLRFDLWYDEEDRFDVEIITPTGNLGPLSSPFFNSQRAQHFYSEFNYYHNGSAVDFYNAENNKKELFIDFIKSLGSFTIRLIGTQVNNGTFHTSLNPSRIFHGNNNSFESFVVPGYTIWDLASAHNNITPNSYVLRQNWIDIDGITRTDIGNEVGEGELWPGSGVGPTYDGRLGITVSVPGNTNICAYAPRSYFASLNHVLVQDGNGMYGTLGAVSGAAPALTGIIALMLEADSSLDASQVKSILENTARSDAFTGEVPNNKWGHGKTDAFAAISSILGPTSIVSGNKAKPDNFFLAQNFPNPFNPSTTIHYNLPKAETVKLEIFDMQGRRVSTLVNERQSAGSYKITWNGNNLKGKPASSGVYIYQIRAGNLVLNRKMLLMK